MRRKAGTLALLCAAVLALTAPATAAATETREEYAAQVNPICISANQQGKRVVEGYSRALRKAAKAQNPNVGRFNRMLIRTLRRLDALAVRRDRTVALVAPAPGDEALVSSWLATRRNLQAASEQTTRLTKRLLALLGEPDGPVGAGFFEKVSGIVRKRGRAIRNERRLARIDHDLVAQLGVPACSLDAGFGLWVITVQRT